MRARIKPSVAILSMAFSVGATAHAMAEDNVSTVLGTVEVQSTRLYSAPEATRVEARDLAGRIVATSDTATLLQNTPGVSAYSAGGVSSLPVVHGLADDRLRIKVDGMDLIASCPNHMNSPLSYIDPSQVGALKVYSGISPVSLGGDSIGAVIIADSRLPEFAAAGAGMLSKGELGARYRSNGDSTSMSASATIATENLSINYAGAQAQSGNYKAGANFKRFAVSGQTPVVASDVVGSSAFESRNHLLTVAMRADNHLLEAKYAYQDIPYELYPNQRMDMLGNESKRGSLRYLGQFEWGNLEARAYHERVDHHMDFGSDRLLSYGTLAGRGAAIGTTFNVLGMPMNTAGETSGVSVKSEIALSARDLLRVGLDLQKYRLNDWWPPAPDCGYTGASNNCVGGMAPDTFLNINNGKRDRNGMFGELETQWSKQWLSMLGMRVEQVTTNTGTVHGYNTSTTPGNMMTTMYEGSSVGTRAAFNAMDRKRQDINWDATALGRYTPNESSTYEFGLAQKTRSPNLYERYSWSTSSMAMEMINMVGDGNGYLGNPNLRPEVARTLSVTADWHSADREWEFRATPYFTRVTDYIDAVRRPTTVSMSGSDSNATRTTGFVKLQYANQDARLYGIDLSGRMPLAKGSLGDLSLNGMVSYTKGENLDTNDGLYNIMPLNGKALLKQRLGAWDNALEVIGVTGKHDVSATRNELKTPGYGLVNLRASYTMSRVRFDFGVENLFDKLYYQPLGGAYIGEGAGMSFNREVGTVAPGGGNASAWGTAVPGMGRSIYAGMTVKF